jgi:hypothetical protein
MAATTPYQNMNGAPYPPYGHYPPYPNSAAPHQAPTTPPTTTTPESDYMTALRKKGYPAHLDPSQWEWIDLRTHSYGNISPGLSMLLDRILPKELYDSSKLNEFGPVLVPVVEKGVMRGNIPDCVPVPIIDPRLGGVAPQVPNYVQTATDGKLSATALIAQAQQQQAAANATPGGPAVAPPGYNTSPYPYGYPQQQQYPHPGGPNHMHQRQRGGGGKRRRNAFGHQPPPAGVFTGGHPPRPGFVPPPPQGPHPPPPPPAAPYGHQPYPYGNQPAAAPLDPMVANELNALRLRYRKDVEAEKKIKDDEKAAFMKERQEQEKQHAIARYIKLYKKLTKYRIQSEGEFSDGIASLESRKTATITKAANYLEADIQRHESIELNKQRIVDFSMLALGFNEMFEQPVQISTQEEERNGTTLSKTEFVQNFTDTVATFDPQLGRIYDKQLEAAGSIDQMERSPTMSMIESAARLLARTHVKNKYNLDLGTIGKEIITGSDNQDDIAATSGGGGTTTTAAAAHPTTTTTAARAPTPAAAAAAAAPKRPPTSAPPPPPAAAAAPSTTTTATAAPSYSYVPPTTTASAAPSSAYAPPTTTSYSAPYTYASSSLPPQPSKPASPPTTATAASSSTASYTAPTTTATPSTSTTTAAPSTPSTTTTSSTVPPPKTTTTTTTPSSSVTTAPPPSAAKTPASALYVQKSMKDTIMSMATSISNI